MPTRILLAEDNEPLARTLAAFLTGEGHAVQTAGTGRQALAALAETVPDLLLLDLRLPELSGVEVLQQLRREPRWSRLPVVVMTGVYRGEKYAEAARRLGVRHYLEKPFSREAFLAAIAAALTPERPPATLLQLLVDCYNRQATGQLSFAGGTTVALVQGEPTSFQTPAGGEFGDFLLTDRTINRDDRQLYGASGEGRLFLTQAGILPYDELLRESRRFLTRKLSTELAASTGFTFRSGPVTEELPLVPVALPSFLYQAARDRLPPFAGSDLLARYGATYPARTRLFFRRANLVILEPEDVELLERIDGRHSVRQLMEGRARQESAAAFLHYLLTLQMIDCHPAPAADAEPDFPQKTLFNRTLEEALAAPEQTIDFDDLVAELSGTVELAVGTDELAAPLSPAEIGFEQEVQRDHAFIADKNYYELFGLTSQTFSFSALKEAYFAKTRQYAPEKFMTLAGHLQAMAQEILAVYANAYSTLSTVVAKERYDELLNANRTVGLDGRQDNALQAKIQFESGGVFLEMGEYENAEKALQEAYTLEPDNPRHAALLAWALYSNPANRSSRVTLERARSLLTRSLQAEKTAEAYAFRGMMLLDEGRDGLAEGEFHKALKLNPREKHARRGLMQIAEQREGEKKGLLRKLFG